MQLQDEKATADLIGLKPTTLAKWRIRGEGPPFHLVGRSVRYDRADIEAWLASRKRNSTSQAA